MNVKGKIEKINPNANNPKSFGILVNGEWYSIFCPNGNCPLFEGQDIDLEYLEKPGTGGKVFKNIQIPKEGIEVDNTREDQEFKVETIGETVVEDLNKKIPQGPASDYQDRINRSVAISYAKDIVVAQIGQGKEINMTKLKELAGSFYMYIQDGQ